MFNLYNIFLITEILHNIIKWDEQISIEKRIVKVSNIYYSNFLNIILKLLIA